MHNDDRLVVVKRCDVYETAEVDRAVEELFAALHAEELVGPGKREIGRASCRERV